MRRRIKQENELLSNKSTVYENLSPMVFAKTNHLKINQRQDSYLFALSNEIKFWNHYLNLDRLRIAGCLSISEICNNEKLLQVSYVIKVM